jgi:hypothetical protein
MTWDCSAVAIAKAARVKMSGFIVKLFHCSIVISKVRSNEYVNQSPFGVILAVGGRRLAVGS